jgi:hypothetical protein
VDGGTPFGGGSFRLMCLARDGDAAQRIQEELDEYFRAPFTFHLIPPWSPVAAQSPGQWQQYRLARQTYHKLISAGAGTREDPAISDLDKRVSEALQQGDGAEVRKLQTERQKLYEKRRDEELRRLADLNDGTVDTEVVKQYIEQQKKPASDETGADEDEEPASLKDPGYQRMAARMGQIELADGKPVNGSDRFSAKFGSAHHTTLVINIPFLNFDDAAEGAPALVRWLDARGCQGMKYEFNIGSRRLPFD